MWIDVLNEVDSAPARRCIGLLDDGAPVALTDVIFTEILQGFSSERAASRVEKHLRAFPILRLDGLEDFSAAARLYRTARQKGVTVRRTLDCLIAAPCIRERAPILHNDDDFDRLATCTALEMYS